MTGYAGQFTNEDGKEPEPQSKPPAADVAGLIERLGHNGAIIGHQLGAQYSGLMKQAAAAIAAQAAEIERLREIIDSHPCQGVCDDYGHFVCKGIAP